MRRHLNYVICAALILSSQRALGQRPEPAQAPPVPTPSYESVPLYAPPAPAPHAPAAVARPAPQPALSGGAILIEPSTRVEHLLEAAEHLDAAGLNHLAAHARGEAERRQRDVDQKRRELGRLQEELQIIGGDQRDQLLVKVKVVEFSLKKAQQLGFDFGNFERHAECPTSQSSKREQAESTVGKEAFQSQACDPKTINQFVESALTENVAKIVAEPVIVTVMGRDASLFVGKEVPSGPTPPASNVLGRVGTEIDIKPHVIDRDRINLQVRARVSEIDPKLARATAPGIRIREVSTGFEVELGKTMVVQGLLQLRKPTQQDEEAGARESQGEVVLTMFQFTPELIQAAAPRPITR